MKSLILDHPLRHILQNLVCYVPGAMYLQRARAKTGAMNEPSVMAEWANLVAQEIVASGKTVDGARIVEIGPGHSMGVAFGLLAAGAKEVCAVDVRKYADLSNIDPYKNVIAECEKIGLVPHQSDVSAEKLALRLHYKLVGDDGKWPVEDASIDVVYSYFSGEHLRQPADVVRATHRILRPGGICIFAIDLEDHLHREDNWLQFLYYKHWLWEAMFSRRGAWTNRLMAPDWRALFEQHFDKVSIAAKTRAIPSNFDIGRVASSFKKYDLGTLSICSLWVVATQPKQNPYAT